MKKICTNCKWYTRSFFQKLFKLPPVHMTYAKCQNPQCLRLDGNVPYCTCERMFSTKLCTSLSCGIEGIFFEDFINE